MSIEDSMKISNIISQILPESNRFERIWKIAQTDFKRNYYNDTLGLFWALLNPLLRLSVYYFAFTFFIERVREGIDNFALFLFSALIFWMEFTKTMRKGMRVLIQKRYLIENIKFQKIDLFISLSISSLIAFLFNITAYVLMAMLFGVRFNQSIIFLPILILNLYLISLGIGMILSIIFIYFKDINHLLDILILFGFWTSGVVFPAEKVLKKLPFLYYSNPFIGIFENVRAILVYQSEINFQILCINFLFGLTIYTIGVCALNNHSQDAFELI